MSEKQKKYKAQSIQTDVDFVVLAGAEASMEANASLSKGYAKIRNSLIEKGKLLNSNGKLILQEDYFFISPSQAAAILLGYPCSGPDYWLDESGVSLKQKEAI